MQSSVSSGAMGAIVALPGSGSAYTDSLYAAVRRQGITVREGIWSGRWLLRNVAPRDTLHLHWPSFQYYDPSSSKGTSRALLRFICICLLLKLRGTQFVWTAHNLYPHDGGRNVWQHRVARRFVVRIVDRILAHGATAAAIIAAEFPASREKLCVVPHGHWIDAYPGGAGRDEARRTFGVDAASHVHLFFGLCKPYKGLEALIDASSRQPAGNCLIIAGKFQSRDYEERITQLAKLAGPERVQIHSGYVDDADVSRYFTAADSVVLPYRDILTSGAALLALSFGKPVVAPRLGALIDVVPPECGLLYDDRQVDALSRALQQVRTRSFDSQQVRRAVARFTWDDGAKALVRQHQAHDASARSSYRKTTSLALAATLIAAALGMLLPGLSSWLAWLAAAAGATVVTGGLVVLNRLAREQRGQPDRFHAWFNRIPSSGAATRGIRRWLGTPLRAGDTVVVRSAAEIEATLDDAGKLDGLPFMPEMLPAVGRNFVVDRRIDKINDWLADNEKRSVRDVVTLVDSRCPGTGHGNCQAACQILWHERWLQRVVTQAAAAVEPAQPLDSLLRTIQAASSVVDPATGTVRHSCQITALPALSRPISPRDWRQDLRPLLNGNVPVAAWWMAMLTRLFNRVQALRSGAGFPVSAPQLATGPTPSLRLDLQPGELVRVRSKHEIAQTLHRNKNRGMWFGKETLRFCNQRYVVRSQVRRIIDERTGRMLELDTPCVILETVSSTGEFLRFCPQSEYVFWREIWLERVRE